MVPFVGGSYLHQSPSVSVQFTMNMFQETIDNSGAVASKVLLSRSGTRRFCDLSSLSTTGCRGVYFTSTSRLFAVYGRRLIEADATGTVIATHILANLSTKVSMTDNGTYLAIADGEKMYYLNLDTDTLITVDTGLAQPVMVKYLAQRFISFSRDTNQYSWSNAGPTGVLTWSGAFASAEGSADKITCIATTQGDLFLGGPRSYEVHTVTKDNDAPFRRVKGSFTNIGVEAPDSVAEIADTIFWLGSSSAGSNQVFMLQGYNAVPVSDNAITHELSESVLQDAVGFAWQERGHTFYGCTLPTSNKTLVYDVGEQSWHHRGTRNRNSNSDDMWEPQYMQWAWGKIICGGATEPSLLWLDPEAHDEYDGRVMRRLHRSPQYRQDMSPVIWDYFELDAQSGVGLTAVGQGHDPLVMLRYSDDEGREWSDVLPESLGKVGQYGIRPKWPNLGIGTFKVIEVAVTDPVPFTILGAKAKTRRSSRV
jgi:hypothetical protein